MKRVLDSYALMAFLEKEPGYEQVESFFTYAVEHDTNLLMSVVNFGEVYYIVLRECGQQKLNEVMRAIESLPIDILPVDRALTQETANFKAHKKMSYADCFAAALAKTYKATLVTGDKEFKEVESLINIHWL